MKGGGGAAAAGAPAIASEPMAPVVAEDMVGTAETAGASLSFRKLPSQRRSFSLFPGAQTEKKKDGPLDVEFRDAGFVGEDVPDELVDVLSRVGRLDALFLGVLGEARLVLEFEFGVAVLGVDVVAYPDKLLVVVGAREEDDGHADQVARGDPVR